MTSPLLGLGFVMGTVQYLYDTGDKMLPQGRQNVATKEPNSMK